MTRDRPEADGDSGTAHDPGTEPDTELDDAIDAILDAYALKDERRTGWQLRGVDDPESVAGHTWGVAYLVLALGDRFDTELGGVDLGRALRLAVVHDVAEAETGDVATRADTTADNPDPTEKVAAEREAIADLTAPLPARVRDAFEEYAARETPAAIVVKECDLLDTCVQALVYERNERYDPDAGDPEVFREYDGLDEFFETTVRRLRTETGRSVFERLHERYRAERSTGFTG